MRRPVIGGRPKERQKSVVRGETGVIRGNGLKKRSGKEDTPQFGSRPGGKGGPVAGQQMHSYRKESLQTDVPGTSERSVTGRNPATKGGGIELEAGRGPMVMPPTRRACGHDEVSPSDSSESGWLGGEAQFCGQGKITSSMTGGKGH